MSLLRQLDNIKHAILDRDGVINHESPNGYVLSPGEFIWIPGAITALSMLAGAGIKVSVATNQSCIGRGMIDKAGLDMIHEKMENQASENGGFFSGIHFCPHAPGQGCACRKPAPGLLEAAVEQTGISRRETVFIGDSGRDLQAAEAAGIIPVLVRTGKGAETEKILKKGFMKGVDPESIAVFDDLLSACRVLTAGKENPGK